jgi:hypothetical protein
VLVLHAVDPAHVVYANPDVTVYRLVLAPRIARAAGG